jgi:DNA-binding NtrC family response regulator
MDMVIKGDMDGIDTTHQINKLYDTPVIYITAYFDEDTLKRAKKTKSYGHIIKPYKNGQINTAILIAINKHQQLRINTQELNIQSQKIKHFF